MIGTASGVSSSNLQNAHHRVRFIFTDVAQYVILQLKGKRAIILTVKTMGFPARVSYKKPVQNNCLLILVYDVDRYYFIVSNARLLPGLKIDICLTVLLQYVNFIIRLF